MRREVRACRGARDAMKRRGAISGDRVVTRHISERPTRREGKTPLSSSSSSSSVARPSASPGGARAARGSPGARLPPRATCASWPCTGTGAPPRDPAERETSRAGSPIPGCPLVSSSSSRRLPRPTIPRPPPRSLITPLPVPPSPSRAFLKSQTGEILETRLTSHVAALRRAIPDAVVTFADAPVDLPLRAGDDLPLKTWWREDGGDDDGWDAILATLRAYWRSSGPFVGVVGFSQGASVAVLLAALMADAESSEASFASSLEWVVLCAGRVPARGMARLLAGEKIKIRAGSGSTRREEEPGSCLVPRVRSARALVIAGDADEAVPPAASLECADWFEDAEVWTHAGGHHFPASRHDVDAFVGFIVEGGDATREVSGSEDGNKVLEKRPTPRTTRRRTFAAGSGDDGGAARRDRGARGHLRGRARDDGARARVPPRNPLGARVASRGAPRRLPRRAPRDRRRPRRARRARRQRARSPFVLAIFSRASPDRGGGSRGGAEGGGGGVSGRAGGVRGRHRVQRVARGKPRTPVEEERRRRSRRRVYSRVGGERCSEDSPATRRRRPRGPGFVGPGRSGRRP